MIDWLADTLLATTLLMALVLVVREPVRRHFGPAAAYGLWLVPALRLLMPPLTRTIERTTAPLSVAPVHFTQVAPAADAGVIAQLGGWETLALSAWLAGVAIMLVGGTLIYRWQRREVLRDSVQIARLGRIRIIRTPTVHGPMAFGILDQVIAVPIDFDDRFQPDELQVMQVVSDQVAMDLRLHIAAPALLFAGLLQAGDPPRPYSISANSRLVMVPVTVMP